MEWHHLQSTALADFGLQRQSLAPVGAVAVNSRWERCLSGRYNSDRIARSGWTVALWRSALWMWAGRLVPSTHTSLDPYHESKMPTTPPIRLYKYQPFSARVLTALKTRTIWFGRPARLGDPFDCAIPWRSKPVTPEDCLHLLAKRTTPPWDRVHTDPQYIDAAGHPTPALLRVVEKAGRDALTKFAEESYSNRGVTCFSESPDNTLLWSHYGGGHRGICLEFDTSSPWLNRLHPVRYTDELTELDVVDLLLNDKLDVLRLVLTKALCWSYEREWRAIHAELDTEYCYGVDALAGVYLGAALSAAEKDLVAHTIHGAPTKLYEVVRAETSFRLDIRQISYVPYDYAQTKGV